jgi:hypothetical protein
MSTKTTPHGTPPASRAVWRRGFAPHFAARPAASRCSRLLARRELKREGERELRKACLIVIMIVRMPVITVVVLAMTVGEVYKTQGHPESFQVEAKGGHIYANVPDAGMVVESIDRKSGALTKWPLKALRGNYAMALDEENHRLFSITRKTPMMVVLNTDTGAEVARLRAAGECDDVFFDAARKRIYVIGGEGFISVFQENDPDHYSEVARIPSGIGIRTGYFFTRRDRFYVGVPAKGNEPAQVWTYEAED